jgi:hypothetical protein
MLRTMAELQDTHNRHVHPQWRDQGYAYYRAIWVECAELLDHYGWKWWKLQDGDLDQVKLELVDIWHFALSDLLRAEALGDDVAQALVVEGSGSEPESFRLAVEALAESVLVERRFVVEPFARALAALPLPYEELFRLYVGKNVLNNFRQAHGYRTGAYQKLWHGREDNVHLIEALDELSCDPGEVPELLYAALEQRYPD